MSNDVVFVDTETTGLNPELNPVWEIAVIRDDEEFCWQVQLPALAIVETGEPPPDQPYIDRWVLDNTGFGERYDASTAWDERDSVDRFCELTDGRHIVGAVPSFDEERLRRMFDTYYEPPGRYPWHYHLIDIEALAVGHLAARGVQVSLPWSSDDLSRMVGVEPTPEAERHTALADARWAKAVYEAIVGYERPFRAEVYHRLAPSVGGTADADYRWRVVHSSNGETMASGEGYADKRDRDHAVALLFPGVDIVEVDQ